MPAKKAKKVAAAEYVLHYWAMRGRAEAIRLTLALCGLDWKESHVTDEVVAETKEKAGSADSPFGQWRSPSQWIAGGKGPSVADIVLFDLYEALSNSFGADKLSALYPKCAEHSKHFAEIEEIAEYLKSDKRPKD
jgi:hypothetical protein